MHQLRIDIQQSGHTPIRVTVYEYNNGWSQIEGNDVNAGEAAAIVAPLVEVLNLTRAGTIIANAIAAVAAAQEQRVDKLLSELERARDVARAYKETI